MRDWTTGGPSAVDLLGEWYPHYLLCLMIICSFVYIYVDCLVWRYVGRVLAFLSFNSKGDEYWFCDDNTPKWSFDRAKPQFHPMESNQPSPKILICSYDTIWRVTPIIRPLPPSSLCTCCLLKLQHTTNNVRKSRFWEDWRTPIICWSTRSIAGGGYIL